MGSVEVKEGRTYFDTCWQVALRHLLQDRENLTLGEVAGELEVSLKHFGLVKNGQAFASEDLKERIAKYFGLELDEMAYAGRRFLQEGIWFPYQLQLDSIKSRNDKARKIYDLAVKERGLALEWFRVNYKNAPGVEEYAAGKITEADLYEQARKQIKKLLEAITISSKRRSQRTS